MTITPSWASVLAELEQAVSEADRMLNDPRHRSPAAEPWQPPATMGPLPAELRERAAELLERQAATAEALARRIAQTRKVRQATARMSPRANRPVAAFIDQEL